jgi:hypothetical protein
MTNSNNNNVYKFEPNIPDEIYFNMLIPDEFKDSIKRLASLTGKSIKEIPYLGDMFFSFSASTIHRNHFIFLHESLSQQIKRILDESLPKREEINQGKAELFLGGAVPSIHFLLPLDSLITCVKRTLDFSIKFTMNLLLNRKGGHVSIHRLSKCFINRNKDLHDINREFERNFPEFRLKFLDEWNKWMEHVNDIRDNVLHYLIIKEGAFDLRCFRDKSKDSTFIHYTAKELENPHEFVESMMKQFTEYITWIIEYNLQQLGRQSTSSQNVEK